MNQENSICKWLWSQASAIISLKILKPTTIFTLEYVLENRAHTQMLKGKKAAGTSADTEPQITSRGVTMSQKDQWVCGVLK